MSNSRRTRAGAHNNRPRCAISNGYAARASGAVSGGAGPGGEGGGPDRQPLSVWFPATAWLVRFS
jgi:hypothetical protein